MRANLARRGGRSAALLLAVSLLITVPSLSAQQPSATAPAPAASDPQAVALIQRALSALAGGTAINDVTLTGSARRIAGSDDETGTGTLTAMAPGESRVMLDFPSGNRTEIRNPSGTPLPGTLPAGAAQIPQLVGAWSGPDNTLRPLAADNLLTDPTWFFPAFTLGKLATVHYLLSYVGQESIENQAVVHISVVQQFPVGSDAQTLALMQRLSRLEIYLDASTGLPAAIAFNIHADKNAFEDIPTQIRFSDYRAVGGIVAPFHVQRYVNNGLVLDLQFENAVLNSGLTSASFQLQ